QRDSLEEASRCVARLIATVDALNDLSKLHEGRLVAVREPIDAAPLVEHTFASIGRAFPDRQLSFDPPPDWPLLCGDGRRLEDALARVLAVPCRETSEPVPIAVAARAHDSGLLVAAGAASAIRAALEGADAALSDGERFIEFRAGAGLGLTV